MAGEIKLNDVSIATESGGTVTLGNATLGSTVVLGTNASPIASNLVLAAGNGIDFSAASGSAAGSSSAVLNDYEEGTWTPTTSSGSWNVSTAKYTKIGNVVTCVLVLNATSDVSAVDFTGLPFTPNTEGGGAVAYNNQNSDVLTIYVQSSGIFNFRQGPNQLGLLNGRLIRACFSYTTDA